LNVCTKGEPWAPYSRRPQSSRCRPGAKIIVRKGQRLAEWIDGREKRRTAPVTTGKDGADRIVITARTYTAKYRDGSGVVREVATGCRDESAARSVLNTLEQRADRAMPAAAKRLMRHAGIGTITTFYVELDADGESDNYGPDGATL
jgi:hypothetical protein